MNKKTILILILGQVGAGKSTVAKQLGKMLKIPIASTDSTLLKVLPSPSFKGKEHSPSKEELVICYNINTLLTEYMLSAGKSIIIDGAFALAKQRTQVLNVAKKLKIPSFIINVICPEKIIEKRATKRFQSGRGVGFKAYLEIKKIYEPLNLKAFTINTERNILPQIKTFINKNNLR